MSEGDTEMAEEEELLDVIGLKIVIYHKCQEMLTNLSKKEVSRKRLFEIHEMIESLKKEMEG